MRGTRSVRTVLVSLFAVVVIGAGLFWWLTKHPEPTHTQVRPDPPAEAKPPASAEKPASNSITAATEMLKDLDGQLGAKKSAPSEPVPEFDVARVEPNGDSVIAGRATPNATVELLVNGKVYDTIVADSTGAFVFVPKPFPAGKFDLTLRATDPGGKQTVSKKSVAIDLSSPAPETPVATLAPPVAPVQKPAAAPEQPVAAPEQPVAAPEKPVAAPEKPATALRESAPDVESNIRVDLVEAQDGGKLYVSGRSTPGSTVRLYLNNAYIATGTASADGHVSFFIGGGVKPGEYRIRLDQLGASDKVLARAEVPFSAPATPVSPSPSTPQTSVAAIQPQQAAPAPQASEPAPPTVAADVASSPKADTEGEPKGEPKAAAVRPASPPVVADAKTDRAPQAAPGASARASEPAARSPAATPETPVRPESATTPEPAATAQPGQAAQPGVATAPRDVASAATNPSSTTPSSTSRSVVRSEPTAKESSPIAEKAAPADATKATPAEAPRVKAEIAAPPTSAAADDRQNAVVVPSIDTKVVVRGDNLWRISRTTYGRGIRYTVIYRANRDQIRDPDLIYPGQIFVLPKAQP